MQTSNLQLQLTGTWASGYTLTSVPDRVTVPSGAMLKLILELDDQRSAQERSQYPARFEPLGASFQWDQGTTSPPSVQYGSDDNFQTVWMKETNKKRKGGELRYSFRAMIWVGAESAERREVTTQDPTIVNKAEEGTWGAVWSAALSTIRRTVFQSAT